MPRTTGWGRDPPPPVSAHSPCTATRSKRSQSSTMHAKSCAAGRPTAHGAAQRARSTGRAPLASCLLPLAGARDCSLPAGGRAPCTKMVRAGERRALKWCGRASAVHQNGAGRQMRRASGDAAPARRRSGLLTGRSVLPSAAGRLQRYQGAADRPATLSPPDRRSHAARHVAAGPAPSGVGLRGRDQGAGLRGRDQGAGLRGRDQVAGRGAIESGSRGQRCTPRVARPYSKE